MELKNDENYEMLNNYASKYKDIHKQNTEELFEELTKKSQVNVEENRQTVKRYKEQKLENNKVENKLKWLKIGRIMMIVLACFSAFYFLYFSFRCYQLVNGELYGNFLDNFALVVAMIPTFAILTTIFLVLIFTIFHKKIKLFKQKNQSLLSDINTLNSLAWEQMEALNRFFKTGIKESLVNKTYPIIKLDTAFDSRRLDTFLDNYELKLSQNNNKSVLYIKSGEVKGNPFYLTNNLNFEMGTKVYTGSITISWTTREGDRTVSHTEVLTASIEKPCPYYSKDRFIIYANPAAPNLSFTREHQNAHLLDEKKLEKFIKLRVKQLVKKSEKQIETGFTVLGNERFDALFNATDRNNEREYRLLFTPLAQQQIEKLIIDKKVGPGDTFDIRKEGPINMLKLNSYAELDLEKDGQEFVHYDYDTIKSEFMRINELYFKYIYFAFSPLLAIPLYQQTKPREYIYKKTYNNYATNLEHEYILNKSRKQLAHPDTKTETIIKTRVISSNENADEVAITAYSFDTIDRVEYVEKRGGDGWLHTIPINWVEYIPLQHESYALIETYGKSKDDDYNEKLAKNKIDWFEKINNRIEEHTNSTYSSKWSKIKPFIVGYSAVRIVKELGELV